MKRILLMNKIIKGIPLFMGLSVYGSDSPTEDTFVTQLQGIHQILQTQNEMSQYKDKEITLFVGSTGAGKSTLLNILAGEELKAVPKGLNIEIIAKQEGHELFFPIGNGKESCTSMPKIWIDQKRKTVLCDCPGFFDNRSFLQDITRAYLMQPLVENKGGIKVVFLAPMALFNDPGHKSFDSLVKLQELLNLDSFNKLSQSISLIVTRFKSNKDREDIIKALENDSEEDKFFRGLMFDLNHIGVVDEISEGDITEDEYCRGVREAITNAPLLHIPQSENITLMPETQNQLNHLGKELSKRIKNWLHNKLSLGTQELEWDRKNENLFLNIASSKDISCLSRLPKLIKNSNDFQRLYDILKEVQRDSLREDSEFDLYKKAIEDLGYFVKDMEINIEDWSGPIREISGSRLDIVYPSPSNRKLTFKAPFVKISDVMKAINAQDQEKYDTISVMAWYSVLWDESIKAPGCNLSVMAPYSILYKDQVITIDLSGANGIDSDVPAQSGDNATDSNDATNGQAGKPGNPGKSSGNFLGIFAQSSLPANKINFLLNGGKGGKGQKGGDGGKGKNGEVVPHDKGYLSGLLSNLWDRESPNCVPNPHERLKRREGCPYIEYPQGEIYYGHYYDANLNMPRPCPTSFILYGSPFKKSGSGGAGGIGGYGGMAGRAEWISSDQHYNFMGMDGVYGEVGQMGNCGPVVEKYDLQGHCQPPRIFFFTNWSIDNLRYIKKDSDTPPPPKKPNDSGIVKTDLVYALDPQETKNYYRDNLPPQSQALQHLVSDFLGTQIFK